VSSEAFGAGGNDTAGGIRWCGVDGYRHTDNSGGVFRRVVD